MNLKLCLTLVHVFACLRESLTFPWATVRLLALLTLPLPTPSPLPNLSEHIEYLQQHGQAFLDNPDAVAVLMLYLQQPLSIVASERTVRATQLLELLLTLFASLLSIPNALVSSRFAELSDLHDRMLIRFHEVCLFLAVFFGSA